MTQLEERVFDKILALPFDLWRRRDSYFWVELLGKGKWKIELRPSSCGMDPHHLTVMYQPNEESEGIFVAYYNHTAKMNHLVSVLRSKNLADSNEALEELDRLLQ